MTSIGGEGKSREGETGGIDKTFGAERRTAEEKKEESSKNVTSTKIKERLVSGE